MREKPIAQKQTFTKAAVTIRLTQLDLLWGALQAAPGKAGSTKQAREMGNEQGREYYDRFHADHSYYGQHYSRSTYFPLFLEVVQEIKRRKLKRVLEVGCGSGTLAQFILDKAPVEYRGFDFSAIAVQRAEKRLGNPHLFYVGDARLPQSYVSDFNYDGIVCTEVLEHIEADREAISNWPASKICICSVPNFMTNAHVRLFKTEHDVITRYGDLIDIDVIRRVAKPNLRGRPVAEYLRQLRWNRNDPKRLLGLLGVNTFESIAGWFVFSGRRR